MITPKKETTLGAQDFLQEQITGLAEDFISLDADVDGLTKWTHDLSGELTDMVNDLNYNFDAVQHNDNNRKKEIKEVREEIEKVDNAGWTLFIFLVIWNFILTGVLAYYVFF